MLEHSIAADVVLRIEHELAEHPGAVANRVFVRVGEAADIDTGALRAAFDTFRTRASCEWVELVIEPVAAAWCCPSCGKPIPTGARPRCTCCQRPAQLVAGDEIAVHWIDLELAICA